jgi:hypothetical protein
MEINRTTDALGRDTGFSLGGSDYAVTYGCDAFGRFSSVTSSVFSVLSGAPSKAWQNLQIERYLPYELTIA